MIKKGVIFLGLILNLTAAGFGQQQAMFTQYMFNGLVINPAYSGSQKGVSFTALARKQWAGMEGAPRTETFAVDGPVQGRNIALGMLLYHDQIGVTNQYGLYGCYAYKIKIGRGTLSSGLQIGFNSYRASFSNVLVKRADDPHFSSDDVSAFLPNVGAGLYYSNSQWYAGFSLPHLLNNELPGYVEGQARQYRHWFASAGYVFDLNEELKLKPNILLKAVYGAPLEVDLNANLLIRELIWVGASYRSFDAVSGLLELQASPKFRIGYAYDWTITALSRSQTGTHELMVNYRLWFDKNKMLTPRYF